MDRFTFSEYQIIKGLLHGKGINKNIPANVGLAN